MGDAAGSDLPERPGGGCQPPAAKAVEPQGDPAGAAQLPLTLTSKLGVGGTHARGTP